MSLIEALPCPPNGMYFPQFPDDHILVVTLQQVYLCRSLLPSFFSVQSFLYLYTYI